MSLNATACFSKLEIKNDQFDYFFLEFPASFGKNAADGQPFGRKVKLVKHWFPTFLFLGFSEVVLLELEHQHGGRATWVLDKEFCFISDRLSELPTCILQSLCSEAAPFIQQQAPQSQLADFSAINPEFRSQIAQGCEDARKERPPGAAVKKPAVAICFSGHSRAFLRYKPQWQDFFDDLRQEFALDIFYHMWSSTGYLEHSNGVYVEGTYAEEDFSSIDLVNNFLKPKSYCVESNSAVLNAKLSNFPHVYLNHRQSGKQRILSQLYSIEQADRLRRDHEARHAPSVAVMRMRFDLAPCNRMQGELIRKEVRHIIENPAVPVIFGSNPAYHGHYGGGGGCQFCDAAFRAAGSQAFQVPRHRHTNDLCDLFALGSPACMEAYSSLFTHAETIWGRVRADCKCPDALGLTPYRDSEDANDLRFVLNGEQLEHELHCFYPEKLLRFHLEGIAVVNSASEFHICRR